MHKSIFSRYIADPRATEVKSALHEPSERILTPANAITAFRPVLGALAIKKLNSNEKGVFKFVAAAGFLDGIDGWVARQIDQRRPDSGLGTSKYGASADTIADVGTVIPVGLATMSADRVPLLAKLGLGAVLTQEATKISWAARANSEYKQASGEDRLFIQPTKGGKEAMAEKFACLGLAVLANETDRPVVRGIIGAAALYFGVTGALRGNEAVGQYKMEAASLTQQAQTETDVANLVITLP